MSNQYKPLFWRDDRLPPALEALASYKANVRLMVTSTTGC